MKSKFNWEITFRYFIILIFGFSFFSVPTFSFIPGFNLLTWVVTVLLSISIFIFLFLYRGFKFDLISISFLLFSCSSIFSSFLNAFEGFKITAPILSILSCLIYLYLQGEKRDTQKMFLAAYIGTILFLLAFILKYRQELFVEFEFGRLGDDFGDVNDLALFHAFGSIYTLYLFFFRNKKTLLRYLLIPIFVLFVYCGASTGSKIFILEVVVLLFLMVLFIFGKKKWWIGALIFTGLISGFALLIFCIPAFSVIKERIIDFISTLSGTSVGGGNNAELSTIRRFEMLGVGIELFFKKPLFGWGIWGFATHSGLDVGWSHNNFSETLCNFGLIGTVLFHFGFIYSFWFVFKKKALQDKNKYLSFFLLIFFVIAMFSVALNSQKIYSFLIPLVFHSLSESKTLITIDFLSKKRNRGGLCENSVIN